MDHALQVLPCLHPTRVVVHAPPQALEACLGGVSGVPGAIGEHATRIATGANSLDARAVWPGCLPHHAEVASPKELVDHLAVVAARLAQAARTPPAHRKRQCASPVYRMGSPWVPPYPLRHTIPKLPLQDSVAMRPASTSCMSACSLLEAVCA
jgi:hypothetical protein